MSITDRPITYDDIARMKNWQFHSTNTFIITAVTTGIDVHIQWFSGTPSTIRRSWSSYDVRPSDVVCWYSLGDMVSFRRKVRDYFGLKSGHQVHKSTLDGVIEALDKMYLEHMKTDSARLRVIDGLSLIS